MRDNNNNNNNIKKSRDGPPLAGAGSQSVRVGRARGRRMQMHETL